MIDKKVVDAGAWVYTQTLKFLHFVSIQGSEASGDHPFMIRIYWHGRQGMKWFKMFHFQNYNSHKGYFWQLEVRYSVTRSACLLEMWSWQNVRVLPLIKWSPKYYCSIKRSTQICNGISLQQYQERVKNMWFSGRRERAKSKRHQSLRAPHQLILQRSAVANQIRETEHSKCCKKVDFSSKDLNDKIGAGIFVFSTWNDSRVMKISKFDFNLVSLWRKKIAHSPALFNPRRRDLLKEMFVGGRKFIVDD